MRRLLLTAVALAAAVYLAAPAPPAPLPPIPDGLAPAARGAIHVHTRRSDGTGTIADVAQAASRAGLRFVIVTDHGDAVRAPLPPAYHGDVLVIDAVEISTDHGHVVALDLPAAPYPLAGEARDVVADIARLGGFAIAAHPVSAKPDLRWTEWEVPVGGLEWVNGDSEWRDERWWTLARGLLAYPLRPAQAVALVFDRSEALAHWDALTRRRQVVAVAAADAHARVGLRAEEPYAGRLAVPLPRYEAVFRALSIALPRLQPTGDAAADARVIVDEIRSGRVYSAIDAAGHAPAFSFTAASGDARAQGGEVLPLAGPVQIEVRAQADADAQIALLRDGVRLLDGRGAVLRYEAGPEPAVYRVEVTRPGLPGEPPVPWIVSNPIYVGRQAAADPPVAAARPAATRRVPMFVDGPAEGWTVEHSAESEGAIDVVKAVRGMQLMLRFAISGGAASHPYAAVVAPAPPELASCDRLTFMAQADREMRVSVQVRAPGNANAGERWHRSVFVDEMPRELSVEFADMRPRGPTSARRPPLADIMSLLFVVDTINTPAGTAGRLVLDDVRCEG